MRLALRNLAKRPNTPHQRQHPRLASANTRISPSSPALKYHLARISAEAGLANTAVPFPPDTSKWNVVEHRLFSFVYCE
jgi:hypothetical protein